MNKVQNTKTSILIREGFKLKYPVQGSGQTGRGSLSHHGERKLTV